MITKSEFEKNFLGLAIPNELTKLWEFENLIFKNDEDFYSQCFQLKVDKEKLGLKTYSKKKEFLNSILEFADAEGMGGTYGFWRQDMTDNLSEAPIVAFGGDGGFSIVAENCLDLLEILCSDSEPIVDIDTNKIDFDIDDEYAEQSRNHKKYVKWFKDTFKVTEIRDPNDIVAKARKKYQAKFLKWMKMYFKE